VIRGRRRKQAAVIAEQQCTSAAGADVDA